MTDVTASSPISTRKHGDVLIVLSNNPPVNALSTAVRQGLVDAIAEAEADLSNTAGFLLDGVVGYIGLLQNNVMNVLTLVGIILTPPIVVASVYGMNFKNMPELSWTYGYPLALGLMIVSTVVMYVWVRLRGL